MDMKSLIYNERTGEFEPAKYIHGAQLDPSAVKKVNPSTYYYIEGISHPYKGSEILGLLLPKGTKIREMFKKDWITIDDGASTNDLYFEFDDSTYFYVEGEPHAYEWGYIKRMQLPKGTKIRKMLDDKWIILK